MSRSEDEPRLRVLVVTDHEIVHHGFKSLLGRRPWVEGYRAARNLDEAVAAAAEDAPDVALVDLGPEAGSELARRLAASAPSTRVLLIAPPGGLTARAARAAGAYGFVPRDWPARDIANAARMVGLGMTVFAPETNDGSTLLSERERQVLEMIAAGATNREIADRLFLSPHTVKDHTSAVYRKVGARNRAQAIVRAQRLGILS